MTVAQLIKKLNKFNGELEVLMSTDEEGNSFGPPRNIELSDTIDGEPVHPDDAEPDEPQVVVIWP